MVDEQLQEATFFDPESFVSSSKLNGRRATIKEAVAIRHNYGGAISDEVTAARLTIVCDTLEKPAVNLYGCGALFPSEDRKTKSIAGPFLVGGQVSKNSNLSDLMKALRSSGFPMEKIKEDGFKALDNATFDWIAFEKRAGKEMKSYDMPAHFVGFEGEEAAPVTAPETAELEAKLAEALRATLKETPEIPRGQLVLKVGPKLSGLPKGQAMQLMGLLLKDSFLAKVEGITFDAKVVKSA